MLGPAAPEQVRLDLARSVVYTHQGNPEWGGSTWRARPTIRERRPAQTLRNDPMPASRKTGATASWMICATVVTDVGEGNMALLCAMCGHAANSVSRRENCMG